MDHSQHLIQDNTFIDWVPAALILIIGILYLLLYAALKRRNKSWRLWQVGSFLIGIILLIVALSPSMMHWGHADMRGHMVQHLLIAMYAPIFMVLGAPITLILKTAPKRFSRLFFRLMKYQFFRFLSHPITAALLNTGGMFVLYLSPLYLASFEHPALHHLIHLHFLLAGYLYTWSLIGPDPAPERPGFSVRLGVLFVSMAAHAYLSKLMYAHVLPTNAPHSADEIRKGAKLMYYWGDLSELILVILLFSFWFYNKNRSRQNLTLLKDI